MTVPSTILHEYVRRGSLIYRTPTLVEPVGLRPELNPARVTLTQAIAIVCAISPSTHARASGDALGYNKLNTATR